MSTHVRSAAGWALVPVLLLALAGCASTRSHDAPAPVAAEADPVQAVVQEAAEPPSPTRDAPPRARAPSRQAPREVVILFEDGAPGYSAVAAEIAKLLPADRYNVQVAPLRSGASAADIAALNREPSVVAVAVGRTAVDFARDHLGGAPLVFCQVFNYQELLGADRSIWGVQPLPPLTLQLRGWSTVDPSRKRIGLIVSEAQRGFVDEAIAAAGNAVEIKSAISSSDRETLYLFKRLAPDVDGLWLSPDNRILSPTVLRELLSYAVAHGIGVLVPNEALLSWGALMSVSSTPTDVARSVRGVLDRVASGASANLPAMTPLAEIKVQVNAMVARELGIPAAPQSVLVLREPD